MPSPTMGRTIWFLTTNQGKVEEARDHVSGYGYDIQQLIVPGVELVEPQTDDLVVVAKAKIEQARPHLPNPDDLLLVEDAGLFVQALHGFPGVYSAHALKTIECQGMIRLLSHLQSEDPVQEKKLRAAEFQAVAALWDGTTVHIGHGRCPGSIATTVMEGEGFGFDPVFIPADLDEHRQPLSPGDLGAFSSHGKTFGAMKMSEKHLYSHRRRALDDLMAVLNGMHGAVD